jgi:hypothetical protein
MERSVGKCLALCLILALGALTLGQGTLETDRPTFENDEIGMAYEFVWGGRQAFGSFLPVRVEIENPLRNDRGVVTVTAGTYRMHYPVELPSRSLRSFVVYVPVSDSYSETTIELQCDQTYLKATVDPPDSGTPLTYDVALIGDSPSLITFLRTVREQPEGVPDTAYGGTAFRDFVSLPSKAPDRAVGYRGLQLVILGEGSERLTDAEVAGIQRYVLAGGNVLFTGGAVSPVLRDARWSAFLPGSDPRVVNVPGSRVLSELTGVPLTAETTLSAITPAPGTTGVMEHGVPLLWYRRCGLGLVTFWAFDPFQTPLRTYAGRTKLFTDTITNVGVDAEAYMNDIGVALVADSDDYYYGYGGYDPSPDEGVFKVSMPATGTVFLILACYFVVVVPLNFLLLNKLGKGQLAWVTSPAIGLCFAAVFFYVASDLYGTGLSRATKALVVAHEGVPFAYAVSNQQLFFPTGGRYDLGLKGAEAIVTASDFTSYYGGPTARDTGFSDDLVDVGEVIAPRAGVNNLAFREIHVDQALPWPHTFPLRLELSRSGGSVRARGALTNGSPYDLTTVTLWIGYDQVVLGELKAGETREINEIVPVSGIQQRGYQQPPMGRGQVALTAGIPGLEVASPLGKEQTGGPAIYYSYSTVSGKVQG